MRLYPKLPHPHQALAVTHPALPSLSFLLCKVGMERLCNVVLRIKRSTTLRKAPGTLVAQEGSVDDDPPPLPCTAEMA